MNKLTAFFLTLALFAGMGALFAAPAAVKTLPKPDSWKFPSGKLTLKARIQ